MNPPEQQPDGPATGTQADPAAPLLSVLCLSYNHEAFIAQTLESFLAQQTNFELEFVVADDCSRDGSVAVIESFRPRFGERLRLLRSDVNLGATRNFRRALAACRGRYVALCEGDDYWRGRDKLQRQVDFLQAHPDFVMSFHDAAMFGLPAFEGRNPIPRRLRKDASQAALIATRPISTLTVCFRHLLTTLPAELDHAPVLDLCLWSLLGRHGKGKYQSEIEPAAYRVHQGGVFSTQGARAQYLMTAQSQLALARAYARLGESRNSSRLLYEAILNAAQWLSAGAAIKLFVAAPLWWLAQRGLRAGLALSALFKRRG